MNNNKVKGITPNGHTEIHKYLVKQILEGQKINDKELINIDYPLL